MVNMVINKNNNVMRDKRISKSDPEKIDMLVIGIKLFTDKRKKCSLLFMALISVNVVFF